MNEDEVKTLKHELGAGIKRVEIFLRNESGEEVELSMFELDQDLTLDTLLIERFYNRKDALLFEKKRGIKILPSLSGDKPKREVKRGYYPLGQIVDLNMKRRWVKDPVGFVVHFHAGHVDGRVNSINCIKSGIKNGYTYWCIEEDGTVYMPHEANVQGYHSGSYHHRNRVGLEIMNSGKLTKKNGKYYTWFNKEIPAEEVRWVDRVDNCISGYYQKFTKAQEETLIKLHLWAEEAYDSFSYKNTIGHDEAMIEIGLRGRKNDPSGSLSMTMPKFREEIGKYLREGIKFDNFKTL
jgi:N-acetyl-anhydromuramyl-L-alanine amidase AmpD